MPLTKEQWDARLAGLISRQEALLARPNPPEEDITGGIYDRYRFPVLTASHAPLIWRYDMCYEDDPNLIERLGVNAVFNAGAVYFDGLYYLIAHVEGADGKSFFAAAESEKPTEGFKFRDYPVMLPDICAEETNVYDMRITKHEDGWIYGVFCSETVGASGEASAQTGVVRTKDLMNWERLPNLTVPAPNRRCCCLHPEFVDGKYAFYTRLHDGYFTAESDSAICLALCEDIAEPALLLTRRALSPNERPVTNGLKNGAGAVPIKTPRGWIHIAHGVRETSAGLRYIIYTFATDLNDPSKVIAAPGGQLIAPREWEPAADVSDTCFTNGCIVKDENVYIYYAASATELRVVSTTIEKLMDYTFNTPEDPLRSADCVKRRWDLIDKNLDNGAKSI